MAETANVKMNIFQKLSIISNELSAVAKNLEVGFGQSKYKAVGEADILHAVKPLETKYGVYSYPYSRSVIETGQLESTDRNGQVKRSIFLRLEVIYRFVNIDNPNEYIDITTYGDGIDPQDKAVGKAMTYADKYALMKAYKIITGEDPDQYASEEHNKIQVSKVLKPLSPEIIAQCTSMGIELENIAKFYKKSVEELTDAEVTKCIIAKKKKVAKAPVADPQPLANTDDESWI